MANIFWNLYNSRSDFEKDFYFIRSRQESRHGAAYSVARSYLISISKIDRNPRHSVAQFLIKQHKACQEMHRHPEPLTGDLAQTDSRSL